MRGLLATSLCCCRGVSPALVALVATARAAVGPPGRRGRRRGAGTGAHARRATPRRARCTRARPPAARGRQGRRRAPADAVARGAGRDGRARRRRGRGNKIGLSFVCQPSSRSPGMSFLTPEPRPLSSNATSSAMPMLQAAHAGTSSKLRWSGANINIFWRCKCNKLLICFSTFALFPRNIIYGNSALSPLF